MNFLAHPIVFKSIEHPLLRNCQLIWKLKSVKESFFYFDLLSSKIVDSADMGCVYVCVGCIVCTCVCVCVCVFQVCVSSRSQLLLAPSTIEDILKGVTMSPFSINDSTFSLPFWVWVELGSSSTRAIPGFCPSSNFDGINEVTEILLLYLLQTTKIWDLVGLIPFPFSSTERLSIFFWQELFQNFYFH